MFTSAKIRNGQTYLGNHLKANDYYSKGEKVEGQWVGLAATTLGLEGEVTPEQFESLRVNLHPSTGKKLTPRTKEMRMPTMREASEAFHRKFGRNGSLTEISNYRLGMDKVSNRVAFFDFQCSAQKSVSLMTVLGDDERLRAAHERASRFALGELERFASCQKNSRISRHSEITGNFCAAAFTHDASRALDPQLHTHFVIANATCDKNGNWRALNEYDMVSAVRYAGKVYQNEMAKEVQKLGYDIREVREKGVVTGFEIQGVPDELCKRFSKRREEIEKEIEKFVATHGREPTVREVSIITRETRSPGLTEITTSDVRQLQRSQLSTGEWDQLQRVRLDAREHAGMPRMVQTGGESQALQAGVEHLFERQSVLPEHAILAEALNQSLGKLDLKELKRQAELGQAGLIRLVPEREPLLAEYGTKRGLELEQWAVAYVNATKEKCSPLNRKFSPSLQLSLEQTSAVRAILTTKDRVFSFRGVAGSGKTTTLQEVRRGLEEAGHRVIALAPTAAAVKVLQSEGFTTATTVDAFLVQGGKQGDLRNAVVICDEAGLESNRQGAELLHLAQQERMRVVFVGDVRQHVSIEAGDFLRVLETHSEMGRCQVGEIHRQQHAEYRNAIVQMASGDARGGLEAIDNLGWVKESESDYLKAAADDYLRLTEEGKKPEQCLVVSPTWEENHRLTEEIRSGLKARGLLPVEGVRLTVHESFRWTNQQKQTSQNYQLGQVVTFNQSSGDWQKGESGHVQRVEEGKVWARTASGEDRPVPIVQAAKFDVARPREIEIAPHDKILIRANDKPHRLINGQVLTVTSVEKDGSLQTKEGIAIPASYRQWTHGYVVTSHKAQGQTCNRVVVAAERLDAKSAYVACSRGRESCVVHTPDKLRLMEQLPPGNRKAALDALAELRQQEQKKSLALNNRIHAWKDHCTKVVYRAVTKISAIVEGRTLAMREIVQRWHLHQGLMERMGMMQRPQEALKMAAPIEPPSHTPRQNPGMRISM